MSLYDEKPEKVVEEKLEQKIIGQEDLYSEITHCLNIKDSLVVETNKKKD